MELNILEVKNVNYKYPDSSFSIDNISFSIKENEFIGVLGCNGAGKSTIFNIINGEIKNYSGEINIKGRSIKNMKRREIAQKIALLPQKHNPLFPYLVRDFILMGRTPHMNIFSLPTDKDYEIVEDVAKLTKIEKLLNRVYTTLSGGEMQLVLLSRALAQEPEILFLDEPNLHLDFRNQNMIFLILKNIIKVKNISVILSLHDPNYLINFADRIILLENGRIIESGRTDIILNKNNLEKIYNLKIAVFRDRDGNSLYFPEIRR